MKIKCQSHSTGQYIEQPGDGYNTFGDLRSDWSRFDLSCAKLVPEDGAEEQVTLVHLFIYRVEFEIYLLELVKSMFSLF